MVFMPKKKGEEEEYVECSEECWWDRNGEKGREL